MKTHSMCDMLLKVDSIQQERTKEGRTIIIDSHPVENSGITLRFYRSCYINEDRLHTLDEFLYEDLREKHAARIKSEEALRNGGQGNA